jgi:hypothetical protein
LLERASWWNILPIYPMNDHSEIAILISLPFAASDRFHLQGRHGFEIIRETYGAGGDMRQLHKRQLHIVEGVMDGDYCSPEGARRLKAKIEDYWRERGYEVEIQLVDAGFVPAMRSARVDVRSDMKNGMPRRRLANNDAANTRYAEAA